MRRATVQLSHGLPVNGETLKTAQIRELNGFDEEHLTETSGLSPLTRSRILLGALLEFNAGKEAGGDLLRELTLGDFSAVLLQVRRMMFGDSMDCVMTCPACNAELSVNLKAGQLAENGKGTASEQVNVDGYLLNLRPVTMGDLERLQEQKRRHDAEGVTSVGRSLEEGFVRSCVTLSEPNLPDTIGKDLLSRIGTKLGEIDPRGDIVLDLTCPTCGHRFQAPFYPEDFFLRELDARVAQCEREVHWIAFNYHWTEDAIMSLPVNKRKRYVELINKTISGDNTI